MVPLLHRATIINIKPTLNYKNGCYVCVSVSWCTTVVHNTAQTVLIIFALIVQTIITAQTMS